MIADWCFWKIRDWNQPKAAAYPQKEGSCPGLSSRGKMGGKEAELEESTDFSDCSEGGTGAEGERKV